MWVRLWAWIMGRTVEHSYNQQVRDWGVSEPFIPPLALPAIQPLKAKRQRRRRKATPAIPIRKIR